MQHGNSDDQERLEAVKVAVCARFGWTRLPLPGQQFYAVDAHGHLLWVKARTEHDATHSSWNWAKSGPELPYAALVGILASPTDELLLVIRVPRPAVERLKRENLDSFRLRWNAQTARDPEVQVLWPSDLPARSALATSGALTSVGAVSPSTLWEG